MGAMAEEGRGTPDHEGLYLHFTCSLGHTNREPMRSSGVSDMIGFALQEDHYGDCGEKGPGGAS